MKNIKNVFQQQETQKKVHVIEEKKQDEFEQLVGFYLGEDEYAVSILNIQEIIKPMPYTRVPKTEPYILGVLNLRGNVIPLVDLKTKFKLGAPCMTASSRYIVIKCNDEIVGFLVDHISNAVKINKKDIEEAPSNLSTESPHIKSVGQKQDGIITILDSDKLLVDDRKK